ncbi:MULTISPECIES: Txe/YoeB family addiction module toxin [Microcystis]|jgi:toxin YoeB|uniref:Endoribonuclease YoeB n=2 Tax=Microcystis TaxID=1125 RepID=B0JWC5_MICAN|nr:Txe/YoeB family addiction module toxin [Microcystis aeruginosa]BAG01605.1 hypothetical protein MAE_17830 [Microcystis aeruginosa NIES-843]BBH42460.1 hypothetical protein myaer102_51120 [Microcystis viridis NIES-102]
MPFSIRVPSLITSVYCITQTEEPKIVDLIDDILCHPFSGIGKPEPLKYQLKGYWSRRINDEHRLVYKITETEIIIISCKFHYD